MEHICFEVQLCSEILIFNENSNFWYTDHPEKSALILQSASLHRLVLARNADGLRRHHDAGSWFPVVVMRCSHCIKRREQSCVCLLLHI